MTPAPLLIPWRGRQIRVRHDDPQLRPYSPSETRLRAAIELATDVEGYGSCWSPRWAECTGWKVADDGATVGLWRR